MYINKSKSEIRFLLSLFITLMACQSSLRAYAQATEVINGTTYDIINVTVNTPSYDVAKPPVFARVKYNKFCPLVITSDDMGTSELVNSWAFFNGYPAFQGDTYLYISKGDDFLNSPYNAMEWYQQTSSLKREGQQPLTYTDNTGGVRRFTLTSAIWPYQVETTKYTLINGNAAKTMIRTGWSFAQHDVDGDYSTDAETIASRFKALSDMWEDHVGIGLKVMVEPNGSHKYIDAGKQSDEICWNIFQNGQLPNYPAMHPVLIDDWTSGTDWTSFDHKPDATTARFFFQNKETEFINRIEQADGTAMILGGTHGLSDIFLDYLRNTLQPTDKYWVAGADEVWEYYHLYNNAIISDITYSNGVLNFNVKIPRYKKHQFRELTINIPGISEGTSFSFSDNVITGGGRQNTDYYTLNLGLEDRIYTYIEELIAYYRAHQYNAYVKNDAQYLIDQLLPGNKKSDYQAQLDAAPSYASYQVTTSIGDKVLAKGGQDIATEVTYSFPKYLLMGTDLYETPQNATAPYYVTTFTPNSGTDNRVVTYTKALENVVYFSEGEDLVGATYNPLNTKCYTDKNHGEYYAYRWSSNAAGGIIRQPVTITSLQPGRYKLVVAVIGSNDNTKHNTTFNFNLDANPIFSFEATTKNLTIFEKEEFVVDEEQTLTLEAANPNVCRWIDYLYIQKIDDTDTGISQHEMDSPKNNLPPYNLMGIKYPHPTKGILIKNGKKIVTSH